MLTAQAVMTLRILILLLKPPPPVDAQIHHHSAKYPNLTRPKLSALRLRAVLEARLRKERSKKQQNKGFSACILRFEEVCHVIAM
jgi:hypothetical protein